MEESSEICTIWEVLSLPACHVDYLDDVILVECIKRPLNVLYVVGCESVEPVFSVKQQVTNVMFGPGIRV